MNSEKKYIIYEAPISLGSPTRGSEDAYCHLKNNGLPELLEGKAVFCDYTGDRLAKETSADCRLHNLESVMLVCRKNRERVADALERGLIPVTLGGDHSLVMSSVAALSEKVGAENVAVIYVDAHADINTEESSPSGMIHGMPLAAAMGLCSGALDVGANKVNLYGKNTYIIGAHSIDDGERPIIEAEGVHLFTPDDVRRRGVPDVCHEVIEATRGMKIHLSFDVDSINGGEFPATGYALDGSLPYRTVSEILKTVSDECDLSSIDVVEYNPHRDSGECLEKMKEIFSILIK